MRAENADRLDEELWFVLEGSPPSRVRRVGPGWRRVMGYSPDELSRGLRLDLVHEDDLPSCVEWGTQALASGRVATNRARMRRSDGVYVLYEWTGLAIPERQLLFGVGRPVDEASENASGALVHDSGIELDRDQRLARVSGVELPLTRSEFDLLLTLLEHRGAVLSTDAIARSVWQYEEAGSPNFLQAHVSRLRRKLRGAGIPSLIETRRGMGYLIR